MDIDITYVNVSKNDFLTEIFFPCPIISPVNIGIIGKTHGVKANNIPANRKKLYW